MANELWQINGRDPVLFRIPFYVMWQEDDTSRIIEAVPLRTFEREAVSRVLNLHGQFKDQHWQVSRFNLERIGTKTPGGDPAAYFSWGTPRPPEPKPQEGGLERNEFVTSLHQSGVGRSEAEVMYWMKEIMQHAAEWLINKEKPVDLYFIKLHNSPYRINWKTILCQRFIRLGQMMNGKSKLEVDYIISRSGLRDELLSLDLLAYCDQRQTCYRHVEVEHTKQWWKLVRKAETQRLELKGPYKYADYFSDSIKRFIPTALRLYNQFLAQMAKACATTVEGGHDGRVRLVPYRMEGRMCITRKEHPSLPPVLSNKLPRFKTDRGEIALLETDGSLPEMSPVQPSEEDLRDRWRRKLEQPVNGKG